ncbi:MAG TPA: P27 family phage terminase small subunit, partial [Caulobacteraceae bacterium]|nr:P27 family phage terminase small subunit [Caulobacteraceae bacterium]
MRGRRAEPPGLQAAKGNPRQRGQGGVKARLAEAARVAKLLAEAPADGADTLAPPKFLDGRFAGALAVWRNLSPKLRETHRLTALHRPTFALFCVYFAEWVACNEDIARNGYYQSVPMTNGLGEMERIRPAVKIRDMAFASVMELSKHFGLTPSDEYAIFRDQRLAADRNPDLFDG